MKLCSARVQEELKAIYGRLGAQSNINLYPAEYHSRQVRKHQLLTDVMRLHYLAPGTAELPMAIVVDVVRHVGASILDALTDWLSPEEMEKLRQSVSFQFGEEFEAKDLLQSVGFGKILGSRLPREWMHLIFEIPDGLDKRALGELKLFLIERIATTHCFSTYVFGNAQSILGLIVETNIGSNARILS